MTEATHLPPGRGLSSKTRAVLWGGAGALLLAPLFAMQFTREVNWGPVDFLTFGAMLALLCLSIELSVKFAKSGRSAILAIAIAVLLFLVVWAELAVGILD